MFAVLVLLLPFLELGAAGWCQPAPTLQTIAPDNSGAASAVPAETATSDEHSLASIHGVVMSKDGELYEGVEATLTLIGRAAAASRSQTTDSNGAFNFISVPPGPFKIAVSGSGFETKTVSGVLHAGESYDARTIVLTASASASVQVTATQADIEMEQVRLEEKQRVLGFIPNFYVTYVPNAPPLTTRQKYSLAWKTISDPLTWVAAGMVAGAEQAGDDFSGYGQGAQGYAKRYGAAYADTAIETMLGGAVLPAAFKQDPRYFYKGTGTVRSRVLYAIANAVICKGDNGHWQFDYSGILGSLAAGGIANLYYPASDRDGAGLTFEETGLTIAGSTVTNLFQEFVVRKLTPKLPHYGPQNP